MKLTKMEIRDSKMDKNQHGSLTYGEWCKKEVERIGESARYVEEIRTNSKGKKVAWCRIDRI